MAHILISGIKIDRNQLSLGKFNFRLTAVWQGGWILSTTILAGIANYLSNVLVGRMLGPADYGVFAAMVSLTIILMTLSGVVQTIITNYVARLRSSGTLEQISALLFHLTQRLLFWGIGGTIVLALFSRPLAAVLQLPSAAPVVAMSLFLIPAALLPIPQGAQSGLQRFGALGGTLLGAAIFRLIVVAGLIALGLGVAGAVVALPISSLAAFGLGMCFLIDVLRLRRSGVTPPLDGLFTYSANALLSLVCFAVLTNGDVLLVKGRFSPIDAGLYSAVAVLGKTIFWLSGAVVVLLLPKVTERYARGQTATDILRKSLLAVVGLCGSVTAIFFLFPSVIVSVFFGKQYLEKASLLGLYGLAMMLLSLVNVWLSYYLAIHESRYAYILAIDVVLLVVCLAWFGSGLAQVVAIMIGNGIVLCLGGELLFRRAT